MTDSIPRIYELFLEKVIEDAHGPHVPEKLREQMIQDLYGRLQNHLMVSFMQELPDEHADAFAELSASNPGEEAIQDFFQQHIPRFDEVVGESLTEFRDVYAGSIKTKI